MTDIVYRPADLAPDSDERTFVISTWSSSYKASHFAGLICADDWADVMHAQLGKILNRPSSTVLVAAAPGGFLYGFIAGNLTRRLAVVYYVYVKDPFREDGIGRGLFAALGVDPAQPFLYTCRTSIVARLDDRVRGRSKIPLGRFSPAAGRYINYQEQHRDEP
jgi:hypothetical protein